MSSHLDNSSSWESLHSRARFYESRLEKKIPTYSSIAQKINANYDEETSLLESNDEQALASEIEHDLSELYDCIQSMKQFSGGMLSNNQENWIKRYYEIHFDYSTEFKNTSATLQRRKERNMSSSSSNHRSVYTPEVTDSDSSSVSRLFKERFSISASMKNINDVLNQAFEAKNMLASQRNTINNSGSSLSSLTASFPSVGRLIDSISRKKTRDSVTIAGIVAVLVCFTIWWVFLR